jgi:hypothetical protein
MVVITRYDKCTCGNGTRTDPDKDCIVHNSTLRKAINANPLESRVRELSEACRLHEQNAERLEAERNEYSSAMMTEESLKNQAYVVIKWLEAEVARLTALVQEHQTYQAKQGEK